jgi:dTDP-4-amino-4,6-dideoxygalactose transaminase
MKIPVWHPSLTEAEHVAVRQVLEIGYLGMGSDVFSFERLVAETLKVSDETVVSTHTGQSALHLALLAIGVGPGDIVITPSFNNVADFQAIQACGARPFFCDVDSGTGMVTAELLSRCPLARARCVIVLDYAAQYCDLQAIATECRKAGTKLIYDAAHTFGSPLVGRLELADATMFSFDPIKTLTAIDAGIIHSNSAGVIDRIRKTRLMGMEQDLAALKQNRRSWSYDVKLPGYRYHLSNIHAAIGSAQIRRLPEIAAKRLAVAQTLRNLTAGLTGKLDFLKMDEGFVPFMNCAHVRQGRRDALRTFLDERGIQTGIHWTPGHHFTLFKDCPRADLAGTGAFYGSIVSLPHYTDMGPDEQTYLVRALQDFHRGCP